MPLPHLPSNPSDAETIGAFRSAAVFLHGEMRRAFSGLAINLGGVFREAASSLYSAAALIERGATTPVASTYAAELQQAEHNVQLLAERLSWPELRDYLYELEYRRTGIRPQTSAIPQPARRMQGTPRYMVAELCTVIGAVPFEAAVAERSEALTIFRERAHVHQTLLRRAAPMIVVDRQQGVVLEATGDLTGIDLTHHAVGAVLSLQRSAEPKIGAQPTLAGPAGTSVPPHETSIADAHTASPAPATGRQRRPFLVVEVVYAMNASIVWAVGCTTRERAVRSLERRVARNMADCGVAGAVMAYDRQRRCLVAWSDEIVDPAGAARYWLGV